MNKKLSHLLSKIKDKIDWVMIVVGSWLVAFNGSRLALDFGSRIAGDYDLILIRRNFVSQLRWFLNNTRFWLAAGVGLIVLGVLLRKDKKIGAE